MARRGQPLARRCRDVPGLDIREAGFGVIGAAAALRDAGLVHSHEGRGVQAAWLARLAGGAPYVITRRVQKGPRQTWFNRVLYRRAAAVVAISSAIRDALLVLAPDLDAGVIPSAGSGFAPDAASVARLRADFGGFVIGHVGALDDSHKGQRQILALATRFLTSAPEFRFVLVGSGRDGESLRADAKDLPNVIFAGQVDNVGDYLAAFDLFLYPSRHEGLGSILIDALAAGLPVVATAVGGIPEIVVDGENGTLVPPGDVDALERAVVTFSTDRELRERVAAANRRRAQEFSASAMAGRYAALYRALAARQQPGLEIP